VVWRVAHRRHERETTRPSAVCANQRTRRVGRSRERLRRVGHSLWRERCARAVVSRAAKRRGQCAQPLPGLLALVAPWWHVSQPASHAPLLFAGNVSS
jgi:hypothetical protein